MFLLFIFPSGLLFILVPINVGNSPQETTFFSLSWKSLKNKTFKKQREIQSCSVSEVISVLWFGDVIILVLLPETDENFLLSIQSSKCRSVDFWRCSGVVLALFWRCSGVVLALFWRCSGIVLHESFKRFACKLENHHWPRKCNQSFIIFSWSWKCWPLSWRHYPKLGEKGPDLYFSNK